MKKLNCILISFILICSCSSYEEKHISKFNIDLNALTDGELVEIIYFPSSPDENTNLEYYVKALVVSKKPNDTVNLLITSINDFPETDNIRTFISYNSDSYKVFQNALLTHMNGDLVEKTHIDDYKPKEIEIVLLNKSHQSIENNNYPTTIGSLGFSTPINN